MMGRNTICCLGLAVALALPLALPGAAQAVTDNGVYVIQADSRSPEGNLRVGFNEAAVHGPAVLQSPVDAFELRDLRHRQYWRALQIGRSNIFRYRNLGTDMCLTVARPEHSPVYAQYCGNIKGQRWFDAPGDTLRSGNVAGASRLTMCLDITEFRNAPQTRLQVGKCHGKWNQLWKFRRVSAQYAK